MPENITHNRQPLPVSQDKDAELSRIAKKLRREKVLALLADFKEWFPNTFGDKPAPLKLNIVQDMVLYWQLHTTVLPPLSKKLLREALAFYTSRLRYHKASSKQGAMRVDLDGKEVEPVLEKAQAYHQSEAVRIQTIVAAKRKRLARAAQTGGQSLYQKGSFAFV